MQVRADRYMDCPHHSLLSSVYLSHTHCGVILFQAEEQTDSERLTGSVFVSMVITALCLFKVNSTWEASSKRWHFLYLILESPASLLQKPLLPNPAKLPMFLKRESTCSFNTGSCFKKLEDSPWETRLHGAKSCTINTEPKFVPQIQLR